MLFQYLSLPNPLCHFNSKKFFYYNLYYYHYIIQLLRTMLSYAEFEMTRMIIRSCNYTCELQNGNLMRYVMHLI